MKVDETLQVPTMLVVRTHPEAAIPKKAHRGDVGFDLHTVESVTVEPHSMADISHGLRVCFPKGYYGRITGRSSTIRKHGLLVIEGILDHGYTGELFATVLNMGRHPIVVSAGTRLVQLIVHRVNDDIGFTPVPTADFFPPRDRQLAGFGSTGE